MSDAIKWGLLVAGIIAVIALVLAIGFQNYILVDTFVNACNQLVSIANGYLIMFRRLINNFFFPEVLPVVTFSLWYLILKPFLTFTIKVTVSIYHYIFK